MVREFCVRGGGGGGGEGRGGLHVLEILFKTRRERGGCSEFRMGFLIVICIPRDAGSDFGIRRVIQHYLWLGFLFFQQFLHGSENEIRVMGDVLGSPRSWVRQGIHVHHLMTGLAHGGRSVRTEQVDALFFVEDTKRNLKWSVVSGNESLSTTVLSRAWACGGFLFQR